MASLLVARPGYSEIKQNALDDARAMQASIDQECAYSGKDAPPYSFLELIGKGSFGRVYKAKRTGNGPPQIVAIKVVSIEEGDSLCPSAADTFCDILKEINTLKLLSTAGAKNVNTIIDAHLVGQSMWMVTEYCAGGSVASLMRPTGCLPERWIIPILREVAEAIYWVHKQGIIHRDIKCANVLVTDAGHIQLCDFGVAAIIERRPTKSDKRTTVTGTLHWMAPELFDSAVSYGAEVDIWAFGSMAYEVASGLPPNARNIADINNFGTYLKQHCPRLEGDQYSPALKDFVSHCLVADPAQRPSIDVVQKHSYIADTSEDYPTSSLSKLVNDYKLWEMQGGIRQSLFSKGGAQPREANGSPDEEWTFPSIGHSIAEKTENKEIYDADQLHIGLKSPISGPQRHHRQHPNTRIVTIPLEKAFDPNTLSNYNNDVRPFYGGQHPEALPNIPPRDESDDLTLRALLIDLGSQFADLETIKLWALPICSDKAGSDRRRTQDWTFPVMIPDSTLDKTQYNPDSKNESTDCTRQSTQPYPAEDSATASESQKGLNTSSRDSALSLIDLDISLPSDTVVEARPSTADSDTTLCGPDAGNTPFHYERFIPEKTSAEREPSLYVPEGVYVMPPVAQDLQGDPNTTLANPVHDPGTRGLTSEPGTEFSGIPGPPPPSPPSTKLMEGTSSRDEVKDELRRMVSALSEQLEFTACYMQNISFRQAGYPSEARAA